MIKINRQLTRETGELDYRSKKPFVIQLVPGGKLLRIKTKGQRRWYTVTIAQIYHQGAMNKAIELKAEKKARREARRMERAWMQP
jgi:hypothetical protein